MDSKAMINRRTAIGAALVGASPLLFPGRVLARGTAAPADPFVVLLKGLYQPVVHGPNFGLSAVDLSDGSYSTTKIYPVRGTPGNTNLNKAIGDFYVQLAGDLCAYHIPGGSFAMRFTGSDVAFEPDGAGRAFPGRNLRARRNRGDGDLSIRCGRPQPHGRQTALSRIWGHRRILLLLRQRPLNTSRDQMPQGRPAPAGLPP